MKLTLSLILIPSVAAWVTSRPASVTQQRMRLYEGLEDDNYSFTWQDVYEFDAPLSHCNEQMFVASEWVKSMPCGEKIEDCDMPEELKVPGTHDGHATITTDVMAFLGLKRAKSADAANVKNSEP